MNRAKLERYIADMFGAEGEHPWADKPEYAVFRHAGNRKWFAVTMELPKERLGLPAGELIDVVNVKCGPALSGALRQELGFFPAYHMSKAHWITIALDGSADDDRLLWLLENSYALTAPRRKQKK